MCSSVEQTSKLFDLLTALWPVPWLLASSQTHAYRRVRDRYGNGTFSALYPSSNQVAP